VHELEGLDERKFPLGKQCGRAALIYGMISGTFTALAPLAQASSGGTLFANASTGTDSGTGRLSTHPCRTISYALTEAGTDSTIKVAAGGYPQPLRIAKPVTIVGSPAYAGTVINPSTLIADTDTSSTQYAVIDIPDAIGVALEDLDIDDQNAQGNFTGCGPDFVGVYYHDASGTMTRDQGTNIQLPQGLFGCQDGQGSVRGLGDEGTGPTAGTWTIARAIR
jgi:hypothetical protein